MTTDKREEVSMEQDEGAVSLPDDFEPWMAEGIHVPGYCPRGLTDCCSLSQIIAHGHQSFVCVGENDGSRREFAQDRFRVCFKNEALDELCDYDKRDLMQTQAVMAMALAVVAEREDCEQPDASAGEAGTATDSEAGVAEGEHAVAKPDAQDPKVSP